MNIQNMTTEELKQHAEKVKRELATREIPTDVKQHPRFNEVVDLMTELQREKSELVNLQFIVSLEMVLQPYVTAETIEFEAWENTKLKKNHGEYGTETCIDEATDAINDMLSEIAQNTEDQMSKSLTNKHEQMQEAFRQITEETDSDPYNLFDQIQQMTEPEE